MTWQVRLGLLAGHAMRLTRDLLASLGKLRYAAAGAVQSGM
jgi:hypothetical protein